MVASFFSIAQDTTKVVAPSTTAPPTTAAPSSSSTKGGIRVSLKVSPGISYVRVEDKDSKDTYNYSANGSQFSFLFGPSVDFPLLKKNVYFSTGVWFSLRSNKISSTSNDPSITAGVGSSKYNLQYIMIPLSFKFYTNEVAKNMRVYFNIGGSFDIKISESRSGNDDTKLMQAARDADGKLYAFADGTFMIGTGLEFKLGNTTLYSGVSYNRGIVNIVNPFLTTNDTHKPYQYLSLKNNLINFDIGVQF
jgi:hypothetical protein